MTEGFWATVAKDGGAIRDVQWAENEDQARKILFQSYTTRLQQMYEVKPVTVSIINDLDNRKATEDNKTADRGE